MNFNSKIMKMFSETINYFLYEISVLRIISINLTLSQLNYKKMTNTVAAVNNDIE